MNKAKKIGNRNEVKVCPECELNPNYMQNEDQQKFETDYIKEHGICNACSNEYCS